GRTRAVVCGRAGPDLTRRPYLPGPPDLHYRDRHPNPSDSARARPQRRPVIQRLKIAIATAGRLYVLDLARELHTLGHNVKFYSYVPRARAWRFDLPDECHVLLLPLVSCPPRA